MGRRKDAERRKRRELRMAERLQQTRSNRELNDLINEDELERDTHTVVYDEASAQGITGESSEITANKSSDTTERMYIKAYKYILCNWGCFLVPTF